MRGARWPSGKVPNVAGWLLCTNANSAYHPSGIG